MRFIVDECSGPGLANWLQTQGQDVFSVYDQARGIDDDAVIQMAVVQDRIVGTNDEDFAEKPSENESYTGALYDYLRSHATGIRTDRELAPKSDSLFRQCALMT